MAQASQDQGAVGVADPDEDSPNMIAYRKVLLLFAFQFFYALDLPSLKSSQQINAWKQKEFSQQIYIQWRQGRLRVMNIA